MPRPAKLDISFGASLEEIAAAENISRARVQAIIKSALAKLHRELIKRGIRQPEDLAPEHNHQSPAASMEASVETFR